MRSPQFSWTRSCKKKGYAFVFNQPVDLVEDVRNHLHLINDDESSVILNTFLAEWMALPHILRTDRS